MAGKYYALGAAQHVPTIVDRGLQYYHQGKHIRQGVSVGGTLAGRAYRDGLGASQGTFVGAFIATPRYIKDQIDLSNGDVMAMDRLIADQCDLTGWNQPGDVHATDPQYIAKRNWWRAVWSPFVTEWSKFRNSHDGAEESIWLSNFWGNVWDQTQDWRKKIIEIRKTAKDSGFDFSGTPEPIAPDKNLLDQFGSLMWGAVKIVLMAGVIFIVVVAISHRV